MKALHRCAMLAALLATLCSASAANITEVDVLNFALNLEYLEATFYKCARDGTPLDASMTGGGPAPMGCQKAMGMDRQSMYLLNQIARDEISHVKFLRAALGSAAIPIPQIDVGQAFAMAADAAANTTLSPPFSPYKAALYFLHGAFLFEDVGVTAYHGALPLLTTQSYSQAGAGIMAVEAYHAGAVRLALADAAAQPTGYGLSVRQFVLAISKARQALSCTNHRVDFGLGQLAPADANGVAFTRSTEGVLKIVYLGGTTKGGFFPNGVNGNITMACA